MASAPARGDLSRWLKAKLTAQGVTAELLIAPKVGGWSDDPAKPGSYFQEYAVLTPMDSNRMEGSLADPQSDWQFPYELSFVGVRHTQIEGQADKVRKIVNEIVREQVTLGGESWKVTSTRINSIGGIGIVRSTDPPEYMQRDVVMVRISKEIV